MILEARRRAASLDLAVEFEVGDAQALRFDDGAFDACRTERMLMHVPDAERAFAEMARVVCRGGRLSVFDFDWETQIVDSPYPETTRLITRWWAHLREAHQTETFFYAFTALIVAGVKR